MSKSDNNILYQLIDSCLKHDLCFHSFYAYLGRYVILAHDVKQAGKKPELNEMRDATDYQLAMDAWHRRGTVLLSIDDDPYGAINLALDYLETLGKGDNLWR